jgi:predicted CopG family antitoxin
VRRDDPRDVAEHGANGDGVERLGVDVETYWGLRSTWRGRWGSVSTAERRYVAGDNSCRRTASSELLVDWNGARTQGKGITESAYNCVHMSKSIRLSEDAYERLAAHKREDETFSDVVLRLAGERSLMELAGILSDEEADAMREAVGERRARRSEELENVADELGGT